MPARRIAFIKAGSYSHTNASVLRMLHDTFPEAVVDVIDVFDVLRQQRVTMALNAAAAVIEQGRPMLASRSRFRSGYFASTYLFHQLSRRIGQVVAAGNYTFSFQTQSMGCDGSLGGVPHFIYTDDTRLAPRLVDPDADVLWSDRRLALERSVYDHATANFTMGSHIQRSIVEQYEIDPAKVFCVGAGCNVTPDVTAPPRAGKEILFVGIEWERKGGPMVAAAFDRVLRVHPDARLTIVGCSPALDLKNCRIVGRVPREQVAQYYREASIFCLPTRAEPFGVVFVEAQMYRLPVVATRVCSIPDIVRDGEHGYLTEVGDVEGLAAALIRLLDDPGRAHAFGDRGYQSASGYFTWAAVGARMKDVIDRAFSA